MRTITQIDVERNPAFAKYVGQTLSIKEINEIENGKKVKVESKPVAPAVDVETKNAEAPAETK